MFKTSSALALTAGVLAAGSANAVVVYTQDFEGAGATPGNNAFIGNVGGTLTQRGYNDDTIGVNSLNGTAVLFFDTQGGVETAQFIDTGVTVGAASDLDFTFELASQFGQPTGPFDVSVRLDGVEIASDSILAPANNTSSTFTVSGNTLLGGNLVLDFRGNADPSSGAYGQFQADNFVVDVTPVVIPEPASVGLLVAGLGVLASRRRRG